MKVSAQCYCKWKLDQFFGDALKLGNRLKEICTCIGRHSAKKRNAPSLRATLSLHAKSKKKLTRVYTRRASLSVLSDYFQKRRSENLSQHWYTERLVTTNFRRLETSETKITFPYGTFKVDKDSHVTFSKFSSFKLLFQPFL